MKDFINDNLKEVLILSAEYIGEKIQSLDKRTLTIQSLIQREIIPKLGNISHGTSEITLNNDWNELRNILQEFRNDIKNSLANLNINDNIRDAANNLGVRIEKLEKLLEKSDEIKQELQKISSAAPVTVEGTPAAISLDVGELKTILQQIHENIQNIENILAQPSENPNESQNAILTEINTNIKRVANYLGKRIENKSDEIKQELQNLGQVNNPGAEINVDWNELRNILQETLPAEIAKEILSDTSIKNFEQNLNEFNTALTNAANNINNTANAQKQLPELLANLTGTVQSVIVNGTHDIQSEINHIRELLQNIGPKLNQITQNTLAKIDNEYRHNIEAVFNAMAQELASVIEVLRQNAHN